MATKRPRHVPEEALSGTIEVRASWVEIDLTPVPKPAAKGRKEPPPLPRVSLPGIEVKDEWLEPVPSSRRPKRKAAPPPLPPVAAKIVTPKPSGPRDEPPKDAPPPSKRPRRA